LSDIRGTLTRPIFVLGLNKSGTSLLNLCLAQHPELSGIRSFVSREKVWTGGSARLRLHDHGLGEGHKIPGLPEKLAPKTLSGRWADPAIRHLYRLTEADVRPGDAQRASEAYMRGMIDPTRRLCEKSPPNLIRSRYLQALFPDATFVTIVRDPYANVSANGKVRSKWGTVRDQAIHWASAYEIFLEDRLRLERVILVKYECFVTHVQETLAQVCRACGLAPEPLRNLPVDVDPALNGHLLSLLHDLDRDVIRDVCGDVMARLGFEHPTREEPASTRRVEQSALQAIRGLKSVDVAPLPGGRRPAAAGELCPTVWK
jgi:hypothetical protein